MLKLRHQLNALHVMCTLVTMGVPLRRALRLASKWERIVHPLIYGRGCQQSAGIEGR